MGSVHECVPVHCPYASARALLRTLVLDAIAGGPQRVPLFAGPPQHALLKKDVWLEYRRGRDPLQFDERWEVRWTPAGGPYPDFNGEITIRMGEDRQPIVELAGSYDPPFGAAGEMFDIIAGTRIAASTGRWLLRGIAADIERAYARESASERP